MELLAPTKNLQRYSVQAIEELFPELHGWGNAVHLNESGVPGDPIALWLYKNGVLQPDSISELSITLTTGTAADLMHASWAFPATEVMLALDALEGVDMFFDSGNAMAPIVRFGYQWYALLNTSFVWVGHRGIAGFLETKAANASQIQRVLKYATDRIELYSGVVSGFIEDGSASGTLTPADGTFTTEWIAVSPSCNYLMASPGGNRRRIQFKTAGGAISYIGSQSTDANPYPCEIQTALDTEFMRIYVSNDGNYGSISIQQLIA